MVRTEGKGGVILLRYAAATAFIGAGLQALLGDFPLRAVLWDQSWWNAAAEFLGYNWTTWVTDISVDQTIDLVGKALGVSLLLFGAALLLMRATWSRAKMILIVAGFCVLLLRGFLIWKEHFWQLGQLIEMSMLLGAPLLYLASLKRINEGPSITSEEEEPRGFSAQPQEGWLRLLIALTFIGHGLYAVGFYPVPANFVFMTQAGLGVGEEAARQLLVVVGVLDFAAALLLLLPWQRAWFLALAWVIPWAILTTLARGWSYGGYVGLDTLIFQWLPEIVVRLPHILLPLVLLFWARTQDAKMV